MAIRLKGSHQPGWDGTRLRDEVDRSLRQVPDTSTAVPVGAMMPYGGGTAPSNWIICNGDAVKRRKYRALFEVIGEEYGAGDGSLTFNVPDLKNHVPMGIGAVVAGLGDTASQIVSAGDTNGSVLGVNYIIYAGDTD